MTYTISITSADGNKNTYACGGATDQEALVYAGRAGRVVEEKADPSDPKATVTIDKDGTQIGVPAVVGEVIKQSNDARV